MGQRWHGMAWYQQANIYFSMERRMRVINYVQVFSHIRDSYSTQGSYGEFNLKKLNEVEGKGQYHVAILNRFTTSENLRY
jgi:hypothetical protein